MVVRRCALSFGSTSATYYIYACAFDLSFFFLSGEVGAEVGSFVCVFGYFFLLSFRQCFLSLTHSLSLDYTQALSTQHFYLFSIIMILLMVVVFILYNYDLLSGYASRIYTKPLRPRNRFKSDLSYHFSTTFCHIEAVQFKTEHLLSKCTIFYLLTINELDS